MQNASIENTNAVTTREATIAKYITSSVQVLKDNSLVQNNMDMFLKLMRFEDEVRDGYIDVSRTDMKIGIEMVYRLTEEFIVKIDSSGDLMNEYIKHKTKFDFDGTINTAHNLIYEFMHRWVRAQSKSTNQYGEYTLLKEFLPVYYSNAFIYFMKEKNVFDMSPEMLVAHAVKKNHFKDPTKCATTFLTIWSKAANGEIGHKEIAETLCEKYSHWEDKEALLEAGTDKLITYINNTIYTGELSTAFANKFAVALSQCTSYSEDTQTKLFKLARHIKDGKGDWAFMQDYLDVSEKTVAEFLEELDAAMKAEVEAEETCKARKGFYQREEIVSVEPGVKYLIDVETETNWVKFLNGIKRLFWKAKNKSKRVQ